MKGGSNANPCAWNATCFHLILPAGCAATTARRISASCSVHPGLRGFLPTSSSLEEESDDMMSQELFDVRSSCESLTGGVALCLGGLLAAAE